MLTTGTLVMAMEKAGKLIEDEELREQIKTCGIGTSATRAAIIEKLQDKGFIDVDKKQKVSPTEFGKAVIPIVERYDEALISPLKTADMEAKLNAVASGELAFPEYMEIVNQYVADTTKKIISGNKENLAGFGKSGSSNTYDCPACGKQLKFGRYGWYCDCKFSFGLEICGHKMKETDLADLIAKGKPKRTLSSLRQEKVSRQDCFWISKITKQPLSLWTRLRRKLLPENLPEKQRVLETAGAIPNRQAVLPAGENHLAGVKVNVITATKKLSWLL